MSSTAYPLAEAWNKSCYQNIHIVRPTSGYVLPYRANDPPAKSGEGGTPLGSGHVARTISFNGATWTVTGLTFTNNVAITGTTNGTAAVTATHVAIFDAADNIQFVCPLVAPIEIPSGSPYSIPIGAIDGTVSGSVATGWGNKMVNNYLTGAAITWPSTEIHYRQVSTAPTASAAGTALTGTGYADAVVPPSTSNYTVALDESVLGLPIDYGQMAANWTPPRGVEVRNGNTAERMFFKDYGAPLTFSALNRLIFPEGTVISRIN